MQRCVGSPELGSKIRCGRSRLPSVQQRSQTAEKEEPAKSPALASNRPALLVLYCGGVSWGLVRRPVVSVDGEGVAARDGGAETAGPGALLAGRLKVSEVRRRVATVQLDEHVFELDVAVRHAVAVDVPERGAELAEQLLPLPHLWLLRPDPLGVQQGWLLLPGRFGGRLLLPRMFRGSDGTCVVIRGNSLDAKILFSVVYLC